MSGDRIEPAGPNRIVFPEPVTSWEELQEQLALVPDYPDREPADEYYAESVASLRAQCQVPEEWVARYAHEYLLGPSWIGYRYADPELDLWIRRVLWVLMIPGSRTVCEERFLSAAERERIAYLDAQDDL